MAGEEPNHLSKEFYVKYLGGHPAYPNPANVTLKLGNGRINLTTTPPLEIPLSSVESIETTTQEKVTLGRALAVGLWSLAWKKKRPVMVVRFKETSGLSNSMVFDSENILQVQTEVYNEVVASRTHHAGPSEPSPQS